MPKPKSGWVDFKEIKEKVSMVQILERYGILETLTKSQSGDRLSGICPIHGGTNKKHFRVSISKKCWNCFAKSGCEGGNVIDFVRKKENICFRDAALLLQEWFIGAPDEKNAVAESPRANTKAEAEKPRYTEVAPSLAASPEEPEDNAPNKPLSFGLTKLDPEHPYLRERGLTSESIDTFGLGYCSKGMLRGYIAIPVHNRHGELVAYAGRWPGVPEEGKSKYKLPRGFKKSQELFNCHRAITSAKEMPLVVVEGFFDAMKLYQAGCDKVVALMGSSLSKMQEEMLYSLCRTDDRIILFFDNDEAGRSGQADTEKRLSRKMFVRAITAEGEGSQPEHLSKEILCDLLPFVRGGEV